MEKDNKFNCKYDECLFNELLKLNGDIHYTPGEHTCEDASIYFSKNHHIQLGRNYVIVCEWDDNLWVHKVLYEDNLKSIFDIDNVINEIVKLKLF